jgi:substrate import-associated zinc metallohydrolase lipoprotein
MMKKFTLYLLTALAALLWPGACSEDALNSESILKETPRVETELDRWLFENYVIPYNIRVIYRMEDIETDMGYNLAPAEYDKSVQLAKLVLFTGLEAFDEATGGQDFIHDNFPKVLTFIGSAAVRNNNTEIVGAAEGGEKMIFYTVNAFDKADEALLQERFVGVVYHEFGHILDQRKPRPRELDEISGSNYVGDTYVTKYTTRNAALQAGFITPYAASYAAEDFTILFTEYVTQTQAQWDALLAIAGSSGGPIITAKFNIVQAYMREQWDLDLNILREIALRRKGEVKDIDLITLD